MIRVKVVSEMSSARGVIPVGRIIKVTPAVFEKLSGKVELVLPPNGGRDLAHFCKTGSSWCSSKFGLSDCLNCTPVE